MTTDRPEDARLVAAERGLGRAMVDHQRGFAKGHTCGATIDNCPTITYAILELERAAAEAAVSALPCYRCAYFGDYLNEGWARDDAMAKDCDEMQSQPCPTCTARRAREETM